MVAVILDMVYYSILLIATRLVEPARPRQRSTRPHGIIKEF
jgi:hypothetical protein